MSVPASKRKVAKLEYVHTAHVLCAVLSRWANRMPKRYAFRELNPLCAHADLVSFHVEAANHVYVKDKKTFDLRRYHLLEAESELIHVESKLATIYEIINEDYNRSVKDWCKGALEGKQITKPNEPKMAQFANFADLILRERKLIAGVKRSDSRHYQNKVKQDAADNADLNQP